MFVYDSDDDVIWCARDEASTIALYAKVPPITKMDNSLNTLANCEKLSISTNSIDRLIPLGGMKKLKARRRRNKPPGII